MQEYFGRDETGLRHLWLEVTGRCNLECLHCYADSGPTRDHGVMSRADWLRVIDEAGEMRVGTIQFIGGEPTLHPDFLQLVRHAASKSVQVEVYSNLAAVRDEHWRIYQDLGICLATSFYSADSAAHDRLTGRRGSQSRTLTNIQGAVTRGIPIRVAIISEQGDDEGESETTALLSRTGVTDISCDRVRGVGRGMAMQPEAELDALCGSCTASSAAVDPQGNVYPCVLARAVPVGNVREARLDEVLRGVRMRRRLHALDDHFAKRPFEMRAQCTPCGPQACNPNTPPPCKPTDPLMKPYDPGRPPDKLPLKEKILPKIKVPKINPGKDPMP